MQTMSRGSIRRDLALITSTISLLGVVVAACGSDESDPSEGAPACQGSEVTCSEDGMELKTCQNGKWQITACMRDELKVCENSQCIEPWRAGSPAWDKCEGEPRAEPGTLRDKADGYEDLAKRLHVHPDLKWMMGVVLPPALSEEQATYGDIERWQSGENDGLWSGLYLTAEAYRYAVTKDPEALAMLNLLLEGQRIRMDVTGVPGVYTRQFIPPNVDGIACPDDLTRYIPDKEKDDNQWVRVGDDGCIQTVNATTMQFESSSKCGLDAYKGYCWLDNVSQDEYSGHMLAHAAIAALVDDAGVQAKNAELLRKIGRHLVDNQLELYDWDGRRTEHGKLWAGNVVSGFMSAMSWGFMKAVAEGTGDEDFRTYIDECLLLRTPSGEPCIDKMGAATKPYDELIGQSGLFFECKSNWNNFSMHMLSLHTLLLLEKDPALRASVQDALTNDLWTPTNTDFGLYKQHNAFFDFIFAADKKLGPASDGPAVDAVRDAFCMMRQFPASEHARGVQCPPDQCVAACEDRFNEPMTNYVRPMAERCMSTFVWWGSPYDIDDCTEDDRNIKPPADYLLPYWMGRYYGFISETD